MPRVRYAPGDDRNTLFAEAYQELHRADTHLIDLMGSGGRVLGFQARQARVLYLALEDSLARLQDRLHKMGASPNTDLDFALA